MNNIEENEISLQNVNLFIASLDEVWYLSCNVCILQYGSSVAHRS